MWQMLRHPGQQRCMTPGNCKPILIQHSVRDTGSAKSLWGSRRETRVLRCLWVEETTCNTIIS